MVINLARIITFLEDLLHTKSHDTLITWSCEVKLQIQCLIFPLAEDLLATKLYKMC